MTGNFHCSCCSMRPGIILVKPNNNWPKKRQGHWTSDFRSWLRKTCLPLTIAAVHLAMIQEFHLTRRNMCGTDRSLWSSPHHRWRVTDVDEALFHHSMFILRKHEQPTLSTLIKQETTTCPEISSFVTLLLAKMRAFTESSISGVLAIVDFLGLSSLGILLQPS